MEPDETAKVHIGFRCVCLFWMKKDIFLGGALVALFATDVDKYGVDAGKSFPQLAPSNQWWELLVSTYSKKIKKRLFPFLA